MNYPMARRIWAETACSIQQAERTAKRLMFIQLTTRHSADTVFRVWAIWRKDLREISLKKILHIADMSVACPVFVASMMRSARAVASEAARR